MSSIPLLLFLFLLQNLPATFHLLFSVPKKKKKNLLFSSEKRERQRERERERGERLGEIGLGLHLMHLHRCSSISTAARRPPHRSAWVRSFFFFFFSYLLVMIQLYFKNWILFCVLCFVFGLILFLMNKSLSFLFFLLFF